MDVVFDLDGTLADTQALVHRAYKSIGIDMPAKAWGRTAEEWLAKQTDNPAEAHRLKNVAYRALIASQGVRKLPAADLADALAKDDYYDVQILTGASYVAARATRAALHLGHIPFLGVGTTYEDKKRLLAGVGTGVYLEDDCDTAIRVETETNWSVVWIEEDMELDQLLLLFKEAEETCKGSS